MLRRKDPYNSLDPTLSSNDGWFTELYSEVDEEEDKARKNERALLLPRRAKNDGTSAEVKKQLPTFLTPDGNLLTGSLEEFGSQLYCGPSRLGGRTTTSTRVGGGVQNDMSVGSSVFLTDLRVQSESVDKITLDAKHRFSEHERQRALSQISPKRTATKVTSWQPLSFHALSEHSGVTELPVKGLGHLAHGRYSMWRPEQSCAVEATDQD